jgi:hypothetical protein
LEEIAMDEKVIKRRMLVLHDAIDVLQALHAEMPAYQSYIDLARRRLQMIADRYTAHAALTDLSESKRKPPQRVLASGRRKPKTRPASDLVYVPGQGVERHAPPVERTYNVIECTRCGCPLGSNRDCPLCYPMTGNVDEENQG